MRSRAVISFALLLLQWSVKSMSESILPVPCAHPISGLRVKTACRFDDIPTDIEANFVKLTQAEIIMIGKKEPIRYRKIYFQ